MTWRNKLVRRGFSLIEVIFTLLILAVAMTGASFLMTKSTTSVQDSKNQIIASMLTQEGIELVRNLKDNESLNPDCSDCIISMKSTDVGSASYKRLYLSGNFYQHVVSPTPSDTPTKFYRRVDVSTVGTAGTNETTVTSYVTWRNGGFGGLTLPSGCTSGNKCVSAISVMPDLY